MKDTALTQATRKEVKDRLHFTWLPGYARYLRTQHLEGYVKDLIKECRELDVPLLRLLKDMPEDQLVALSIKSHGDFLQCVEENRLREKLNENLKKWETDDIEIITREDIVVEDITVGTYVRKKVMLKYLPQYTTDPFEIIEIIKELDIYDEQSVTPSLDLYIKILKEKMARQDEQLLEAQKLAKVGSFEMDLVNNKTTATPQLLEILELEQTGDTAAYMKKIHEDDRQRVMRAMKAAIEQGGAYESEYRLKTKSGKDKIIASKGIVTLKSGKPYRFTGTVADITEKQQLIDQLKDSERLFKQAQAIAHMGSWSWDLGTNNIKWSDELYDIYGLERNIPLSFDEIVTHTHPEDHDRMANHLKETVAQQNDGESYYRITLKTGQVKVLHSKAEVLTENGKPYKLVGTIQDVTEKHTMLENLQRSDTLFKQAEGQTHIGNWTWDVVADKVSWSDEMFRIYGMEPQSVPVTFDTYLAHVHPEYREKRMQQVQHVFETGEPEDHVYKIITEAGQLKILHSISKVQTDEKGKVISMTGTCQDITERQTLIEKLQDSESLHKQAQTMTKMGSWTWDLKTDKVSWTDEMYAIYEIEKDTPVSRKYMVSFQHPDDRHTVEEGLQALVETTIVQDFNYRIVTGKGNIKILHAIKELVRDENGLPVKVIGTTQDITEQKIAERQLRENREFIQKIADTAPSIIASYNINTGVYSYINEGFRKLLGYAPEEVLREGLPFLINIVHPDDLERITQQNAEALKIANEPGNRDQNIIAEFKYRMRHANGEYRWFHTFGTIFDRDAEGKVENILNISIDITAQEEAERVLYQKNLELQQSNSSLEEYAYVASHDLREPLRKICTFSDRLMSTQQEKLDESGKLFLQKISDCSLRMQTMISDLLAISLVSGNKTYEATSLDKLLKDVLQLLEHRIESVGARVDHSKLPSAKVVPSQIRQLFQNLINNSLKFCRQDVKPHITISHCFKNPKEIDADGLAKAKKYLEIKISDNGIGFENKYANKIFAIFQRLHGKTEYEGTGIGLAICKKVVENHGGAICAAAIKNEGATFTIILPAS